jgi:type I restriction enzyme M protein
MSQFLLMERMMTSEKKTDKLIANKLEELGFLDRNIGFGEAIGSAKILLKKASKQGGKGAGIPDYMIVDERYPDTVIVIENKRCVTKHRTELLDKASDYAVDGALHYGRFLSPKFNTICVGVSGTTVDELLIDTFFIQKGSSDHISLRNPQTSSPVREILSFKDYVDFMSYDYDAESRESADIFRLARNVHEAMRGKIDSGYKPLLVSGILLGLKDGIFRKTYLDNEAADGLRRVDGGEGCDLVDALYLAIGRTLNLKDESGKIPEEKVKILMNEFLFIKNEEKLRDASGKNKPESLLCSLVTVLSDELVPYLERNHHLDILGRFYNEFITYAGGDGKGLGIVLTPNHITDFMAEIVGVNKDSIVLDTCTGTGGFLVSAMNRMVNCANNIADSTLREAKIIEIKKKGLIGVEQNNKMYAMACTNMIFRGDGKAKIFHGNSFKLGGEIRKSHPNKCLINPPYAMKDKDNENNSKEIDFIISALELLAKDGILAAIVPMSVAIDVKKTVLEKRRKLLSSNSLLAVLSMPDQLFYPTGTNTCIMVFRAGVPHDVGIETFFGYFKDDGYTISKGKRVDVSKRWGDIRNEWIRLINNKKEKPGFSVMKGVSPSDEWCAEAYMETDYSTLCDDDFIEELRKYTAFKIMNPQLFKGEGENDK